MSHIYLRLNKNQAGLLKAYLNEDTLINPGEEGDNRTLNNIIHNLTRTMNEKGWL